MKKLFSDIQIKYNLFALRKMLYKATGQLTYSASTPKILYVVSNSFPYHANGYAIRTHEIINALQENGINVHVLTRPGYPWGYGRLCQKYDGKHTHHHEGITYHHMPYPRKLFFLKTFVKKAGLAIANYAKKHKITCIHAASNHVNALPALLAARMLTIPFHYEIRGLWEMSRAAKKTRYKNSLAYNLGLALEGFVANEANKSFFISELLSEYAKQNWQLPEHKIHLLPNCVHKKENIVKIPSIKPQTIAYAGALVEYEGLDVLLYAMHSLLQTYKTHRHVHLEIFGEGDAKQNLQILCTKLNLQNNVTFHGRVEKKLLEEKLSHCAFICIPRKSFDVCKLIPPIKLMQAMLLAKTVIVPDLPLFKAEVGNAPVFFFKVDNKEDLTNVLHNALSEEDNLIKYGQKCREYVLNFRQWDTFIKNIY